MRFDDTLETVLAADLSTPFGRQSAWRQLVDLIGRRRVPADSRAIGVLKAIRDDVKSPVRAATARMLEYADPPEALARLFILDEMAIAMPVIRSARLTSDEWIALLPQMAPQARTILRNRRDIGPRVVRALEAFGAIDLVLGDDRPAPVAVSEPVLDAVEGVSVVDCPEMGPPLVDGGDTATDKTATVPDMSLIEQSDAPMTSQDDPADDIPRHRGAPRFVQFGAVALGIPVVAQAVRMAGDAADLAPPPVAEAAQPVVERADGADEDFVSGPIALDTETAEDTETADNVAAAYDAELVDVPVMDEAAAADDAVVAPAAPHAPEEVADDMSSPILPVADALRLAESFPVDSPVVEDMALERAVADAPITSDEDAEMPTLAVSGPLEVVVDVAEEHAPDDATVDTGMSVAPVASDMPTSLFESGVGPAALGGLAILSAVTDWSRGLAGHLDAGASTHGAVTAGAPVADMVALPVISDAPVSDGVVADAGMAVPDAPVDDVVLEAPQADNSDVVLPTEDESIAAPDAQGDSTDTIDLDDAGGSPLALAGIGAGVGAAALIAPIVLTQRGDDGVGGGAHDDAAERSDDDAAAVHDDSVDSNPPVVTNVEAMSLADDAATSGSNAQGDEAVGAATVDAGGDVAPLAQRSDVPAPVADSAGRTFRIADVVARIDAYQKRQADESVTPPVPVPGDGFRFEADARGVIRWVEGVSRGPLIGLALDQSAQAGGYGFDASVAGAFRHRASFSNARLGVAGESDASGDWLVSAVPSFDAQTGRFAGYRGAGRRPRSDERADQMVAKRPSPVESLRELIHELRTPAGAITGFAELIETQMLGPVPEAYREQAMAIRTQARELLAVIDDLDLAARIEARALALRPGSVPLKRLVDGIVAQLTPLAQERQVVLERTWGDDVVKGDERAVDRLIARLLATLVGAGSAGETLDVRIAREGGEMVRIDMTRPAALNVDAPSEPDEDDVAALGTGFALRLAVNLAQELGGNLMFGADRLTLRLPGADDPQVDQAVHH